MSEVPAAVGFDRLPWLADDVEQPPAASPARSRGPRSPRRESRLREWLGWAIAALLMIAGASYWLGVRSGGAGIADRDMERMSAPITVPLPAPREIPEALPPQAIEPARQVAPQLTPVVPGHSPATIKPVPAPRPAVVSPRQARTSAPAAAKKTSPGPALWPAGVEAGASGRMVRIGTFATRHQAKRGWSRIMRIHPGMSRIPALVVAQPSLRDGQTYFRLQMGTTSQAHSEVLCQRMRIIAQSCVVVDVPARRVNPGGTQ